MFQNTKLLVVSSFLIITLGFGFLWFGAGQFSENPIPSPFSADSPLPGNIQNENQQATSSAGIKVEPVTQGIEGEKVLVTRAIDGDTIELADGKTVRLVGIDTPETVDPRRPVGCFGKEASNEVKKLLTSKQVILQKDISDTDKYKRLLRYVFLPLEDGRILFVNDYLVRAGFAKVYTYPPDVKFNEQFKQAEVEARTGKKGLWGKC